MNCKFIVLSLCFFMVICSLFSSDYDDLFVDEAFFRVESEIVVTATGISETILTAPASMVVISRQDIERRGYTSLSDVLNDLPGFDVITANGTVYMNAYQRGYRTPWLQRTLLLIDGVEENHLWSHEAMISRQFSLTNVQTIEVLYGPASAVYGPNAFLGIINVITKDGTNLEDGETRTVSKLMAGSYKTFGLDITTKGRTGDLSWTFTGRVYKSDEEDFSQRADEWGYLNPDLLKEPNYWGPLLVSNHGEPLENLGTPIGEYADPTDNHYFHTKINYKGTEVGFLNWEEREGFGPYYAFDKVQPNVQWNNSSRRLYMKNQKQVDDDLSINTFFGYRESRKYGQWIESDGSDTTESSISWTDWNSLNYSWLYKGEVVYQTPGRVTLMGGLKIETKRLTKAYDIPGYWSGTYQSTTRSDEDWIAHSSDTHFERPPKPADEMPDDNMARMTDVGGFFQYIFDDEPWRITAGIRYDENSLYGSSINPRLSGVYQIGNRGALKLIYGEAFQEPAPSQLFGGWSGRAANPDLEPEKARNLEMIFIYQQQNYRHDIAVYTAKYDKVITEMADNIGGRDVQGLEYKLRYFLPSFANFITDDIEGYFYYTFTRSKSDKYYDHDAAEWKDGKTSLGDIAPHKMHLGFNISIMNRLNLFLKGKWIASHTLYTRNALRPQGIKAPSYAVFDANIFTSWRNFQVDFKINNIFDKRYLQPGIEAADSGNDFENRSGGFMNSMIPAPSRSFLMSLTTNF